MNWLRRSALTLSLLLGLSTGTSAQSYTSYESVGLAREVKIIIPDDLEQVRGIVVSLSVFGMEGFVPEAFARTLGFVHLEYEGFRPEGIVGDDPNGDFYGPDVLEAIAQIALESGHPELQNAPMVWTGFSDGSSSGLAMASVIPERMIAIGENDGSINVYEGWNTSDLPTAIPMPPSLRSIPILFCSAENSDDFEEFVVDNRALGALWARASIHTRTWHDPGQRAWPMIYYFLSEVIKGRYPTDATPETHDDLTRSSVPLLVPSEQTGYLAQSTRGQVFQAVDSFEAFAGDPSRASWLATEALADGFRTVASWNRNGPLGPLGDDASFIDPGQRWTKVIPIDPSWTDWDRVEVYDGARLLAVYAPGDPLVFSFLASEEDIGAHLIYAMASRAEERLVSPPSLLVVEGIAPLPFEPFAGSTPPTERPDQVPRSDGQSSSTDGCQLAPLGSRHAVLWVYLAAALLVVRRRPRRAQNRQQ
jgi:hypothetical protein